MNGKDFKKYSLIPAEGYNSEEDIRDLVRLSVTSVNPSFPDDRLVLMLGLRGWVVTVSCRNKPVDYPTKFVWKEWHEEPRWYVTKANDVIYPAHGFGKAAIQTTRLCGLKRVRLLGNDKTLYVWCHIEPRSNAIVTWRPSEDPDEIKKPESKRRKWRIRHRMGGRVPECIEHGIRQVDPEAEFEHYTFAGYTDALTTAVRDDLPDLLQDAKIIEPAQEKKPDPIDKVDELEKKVIGLTDKIKKAAEGFASPKAAGQSSTESAVTGSKGWRTYVIKQVDDYIKIDIRDVLHAVRAVNNVEESGAVFFHNSSMFVRCVNHPLDGYGFTWVSN